MGETCPACGYLVPELDVHFVSAHANMLRQLVDLAQQRDYGEGYADGYLDAIRLTAEEVGNVPHLQAARRVVQRMRDLAEEQKWKLQFKKRSEPLAPAVPVR